MRSLAFAATALVFLACPALADGPIATAPTAGPAAPPLTGPPPALPSPEVAVASQPLAMGPCGLEKVKPDGRLETAPHGEVDAGVGTNGYRQFGGAVCQPIGQDGALAVSISQTQGEGSFRRH